MSIEIKMPALSPTMETGTLAKWVVAVGDDVRSGDVIAEIETDKATMEVEATDDGVLAVIAVAAGSENVPVGAVIGVLAEDGEDASAITVDSTVPATASPALAQAPVAVPAAAPTAAVALSCALSCASACAGSCGGFRGPSCVERRADFCHPFGPPDRG